VSVIVKWQCILECTGEGVMLSKPTNQPNIRRDIRCFVKSCSVGLWSWHVIHVLPMSVDKLVLRSV